jgi:hypothetical protein
MSAQYRIATVGTAMRKFTQFLIPILVSHRYSVCAQIILKFVPYLDK